MVDDFSRTPKINSPTWLQISTLVRSRKKITNKIKIDCQTTHAVIDNKPLDRQTDLDQHVQKDRQTNKQPSTQIQIQITITS